MESISKTLLSNGISAYWTMVGGFPLRTPMKLVSSSQEEMITMAIRKKKNLTDQVRVEVVKRLGVVIVLFDGFNFLLFNLLN